jgi:hypothetical protein
MARGRDDRDSGSAFPSFFIAVYLLLKYQSSICEPVQNNPPGLRRMVS